MTNITLPVAKSLMTFLCLASVCTIQAQDIGIGTATPDHRLHITNNNTSLLKLENSTTLANNVTASAFFKTGTYYTGGIKTIGTGSNIARLGFFTFASGNASSLLERMSIVDNGNVGIGTTAPGYLLDVNGRMRLKHNTFTSGLWFANSTNSADVAFAGMYDDGHVGFYGNSGGSWNLVMSTTTGRVGIGTTSPDHALEVFGGNTGYAGRFESTNSIGNSTGVQGKAVAWTGGGVGVRGDGMSMGVIGYAELAGAGSRRGVYGDAKNGTEQNYGVFGSAQNGANAYGVYGTASGGGNTWGGYFVGDVYSSGNYVGSDRKLKEHIKPLNNALMLIDQLKPAIYAYKTEEYAQMQLPKGFRFGLIADEVKHILPGVVKQSMQPAHYENEETQSGRILSDAVEFEAINYTEIIPILIGAIQEQQDLIIEQKKQLDEFKARLILIEQSNK